MTRVCALAGIDEDKTAMFALALRKAGMTAPPSIEPLSVGVLGKARPSLLLCDVDALEVDRLEMLRRLRFVLPNCLIAVYTGVTTSDWAVACHLAGANCLLSKSASTAEIALGLRGVLHNGCYTDPRFAAA